MFVNIDAFNTDAAPDIFALAGQAYVDDAPVGRIDVTRHVPFPHETVDNARQSAAGETHAPGDILYRELGVVTKRPETFEFG